MLYLRGMDPENDADAAEMILNNIRRGSDDAYVAFFNSLDRQERLLL